jgi:hypothetical protein
MTNLIFTKAQYEAFKFLNEAISTKVPTDLTNLLNDNSNFKFISFVKNDGSKISFKVVVLNGHVYIQNITKNAMYYNYAGDFKPTTMVYGNKAFINYTSKLVVDKATGKTNEVDGAWKDTITNIVSVEVYDDAFKLLDSMELENDTTTTNDNAGKGSDELVKQFNDQFNALKIKQNFTIVGKSTYDGSVLDKRAGVTIFELNDRKKSAVVVTCEFNETTDAGQQNAFRLNGEAIIFSAVKYAANNSGNKSPFNLNGITEFIVKPIKKTPEELEQDRLDKEEAERKREEQKQRQEDELAQQGIEADKKTSEEARAFGKEVYQTIMSDPTLKKVFFHQPTLLNMIKIGDPVGVVPANKLINKYLSKNSEKKMGSLFKKFAINSTITFEVIDKDLVIADADNFTAPAGKTYKAIVKQREIGLDYVQCVHKKDKLDPEFFVNIYNPEDEEDMRDDIFPATIKMEYLTAGEQRFSYPPSDMGKIKVTNFKFK